MQLTRSLSMMPKSLLGAAWCLVFVLFAGVAALPAGAQDIVPPKVNVSTPGGVNIVDGYFQHSVTDLSIGTLKLERFTLPPAKLAVDDPYFGAGITHNFDIYVAVNFIKAIGPPFPNAATYHSIVHIGEGASGVYNQPGPTSTNITILNTEAYKGNLALVGGAYVYTDDAGTIYTFNPTIQAGGSSGQYSQRIDNIVYADGRKVSFTYNASKQLKLVGDTAGYAIVFDYNASGDVAAACSFNMAQIYVSVSSTCTGATSKVTYGYTSSLLTSVTDVLGKVTTYGRFGTTYGSPISCVTPPGYTVCKITNQVTGIDRKIGQQTMIDGSTWQIGLDIECNPDPDNPISSGGCHADLIDPAGKATSMYFVHSSPNSITDAYGRLTTYSWMGANLGTPNYDQNPNGPYLVQAVLPEGNKYIAEYGGPFNHISKATMVPKPGSTLTSQVETWAYGPCTSPGTLQNCGKPISVTDPMNHTTNYTYASHGGVLSEMKPMATLTDALGAVQARPLKLTTYAQRYAWIKNAGGTLVQAATPIWVVATETQCQTAPNSNTPTCDPGRTQTLTTYEYGATGTSESLLVKGVAVSSGGVTLRTCYSYDALSRKVSETKPNANLGVCP